MTQYRPAPELFNSKIDIIDRVEPADFNEPIVRYRNQDKARQIGLGHLDKRAWLAHFSAFMPLDDNQPYPLAMRYHGHQFRHYNKDLGDGRGFLFAQLKDDKNRLLDLGTKGSGTTPYSRGGDGRLTLKGGVREVLATQMLDALGVNTSHSFSLIETGEALIRGDEPSPTRSSVLVRLSHSHIRFGTFERLAYLGQKETMAQLVDYCLRHYYDGVHETALASVSALFDQVVTATAQTCAQWMAAGFVHGVLNTDNMNITGESFDYGPYRFLSHFDPRFTAAYFDHQGLYAYARQPEAVHWNLMQLARALSLLGDDVVLLASLNDFNDRYEQQLGQSLCRRLRLKPRGFESERALTHGVFEHLRMHQETGSFERFFANGLGRHIDKESPLWPMAQLYDSLDETQAAPERETLLSETLLYDEIETIWAAISHEDDWSAFEAKLRDIKAYGDRLSLWV